MTAQTTPGRVTHGFLDGSAPLFASHHAPLAPPRNVVWVMCLPLHLDLIQSHRSMRLCAEELAAAGFHVVRPNYDGTGESVASSDRDPNRVSAWLDSVRRAVAAARALPGVDAVGLLGVRMGATFALETATKLDVAQLVLWEPSPGNFYAREMEILAASSPQALEASGSGAAPAASEGLVAGGYFLSAQTLADLGRLVPEKMIPQGKPDVLLVYRDDRRASPRLQQHLEQQGCTVTVLSRPGHKEMMVMPQRSVVPTAILEGIRDWATARSRVLEGDASAEAAKASLALEPEAVVKGVRWRPFWFGARQHLFGILSEPEAGAKEGLPAVFFLTGGVTPRTAGNGSYVTLAERLASRGHAVMRMDVSSIGESGTPDGSRGADADPFPASIVEDATAGIARLCASVRPGTKIWTYGLCSGAFAAYAVAVRDDRVAGVFLVNPERFSLPEAGAEPGAEGAPAASTMSTVDQLEQMNRYWQVMRDPESWKKLLSGKADVRHIANVVGARARSKLEATKERIAVRLGRAPKGLAGDLDRLLARGTRVLLVFSEGDPGHAAVLTELGARLDGLMERGLEMKIFPGADHNFHEVTTRAQMIDWTLGTIPSR